MKVLTLAQPWATLVAIGAKKIETRSWPTNYRGPLAIQFARPEQRPRQKHPSQYRARWGRRSISSSVRTHQGAAELGGQIGRPFSGGCIKIT
jgi:hypothetical protein